MKKKQNAVTEEEIKKLVARLNRRLAALRCPNKLYYDGFRKSIIDELDGSAPGYQLFSADRKTDCGQPHKFTTLRDMREALWLMFQASETKR